MSFDYDNTTQWEIFENRLPWMHSGCLQYLVKHLYKQGRIEAVEKFIKDNVHLPEDEWRQKANQANEHFKIKHEAEVERRRTEAQQKALEEQFEGGEI